MSTATALPSERGLPTPVSNLLTSWWLAIAFAIAGAFLLWPDLPWGRMAMLGYILLVVGSLVVLALGGWVGSGLRRGDPRALGRCRLFALVGTILGLGLVIGYVVFKSMGKGAEGAEQAIGYGGATNIFLVGSLLASIVMPPLLFGLFAWSLSMQDEVERFYYPPAAVDEAVAEVVTVESEAVVVDKSSVGTLMSEEGEELEQSLAAQEAHFEEVNTVTAMPDEEGIVTPTAAPFDTGSVQMEGGSADPFATTSATGKRLKQLAREAQQMDPNAIDGSGVEAVEASEVISATEVSESVSADMAEEGSESVLLADEDASALLASAVEEKPQVHKPEKLPPMPSNLDEPLSVGDLELTFDEPTDKK